MHIAERPRPDTTPSSPDGPGLAGFSLPPLRKRRRGVKIAVGVVLVAAAALLIPRFLATPPVPVIAVAPKSAERVLAVTGRIRARESVQVVPRVAGQVKVLTRREGESVTAGEVLGYIDDAKARAALAQTTAAANGQRRTLAQAERDLERATSLRVRGNATEAAVETATLAVNRGRDELRRLTAAEEEARLRLEEYQIVAPFSGRLLTRPVDPGQVVDGRTAVYEIAPTGDREVETEVDETYSTEVALGQVGRLQFPGSGGVVEGRVSYLSPRIDTTTGGRVVRLSYPETTQELPVGLTVDVNIVVEKREAAVMVPRTAIRDTATSPYVQVVRDGKVAKQPITFKDWPSPMVMVSEGLKAGDKVITGAPQTEGASVETTLAPAPRGGGRPPARP